jgi:cytochrome c peroxidase
MNPCQRQAARTQEGCRRDFLTKLSYSLAKVRELIFRESGLMMAGAVMRPWTALVIGIAAAMLLAGCKQDDAEPVKSASSQQPAKPAQETAFYTIVAQLKAPVPAMMALGKKMFADPSLSASGKQSCMSCHDPAHAYAPNNGLSAQLGGPDMKSSGTRAVPSLRYVNAIPSFAEHFFDDEDNDGSDQGPTGGHTWDGRAQSFHDQMRIPLMSPYEMANESPAAVIAKVKAAPYADEFRKTFGEGIFDNQEHAFVAIQMSLESYLETPAEFYPYTSKFDAVMRKQAKFTPAEARGLALFNDPNKGNCAQCHISKISSKGTLPVFSDWGHIAIGVPRNAKLPANANPDFYDLGLCGPERTDFKDKAEYCGLFRTPSLRNVATRKAFFHNGAVHTLTEAVRFYAERDTHPEKWYSRDANGNVKKFDDLPERYQDNVNTEAPFGRKPGDPNVLSESEIRDIVSFLGTLTDGYKVQKSAPSKQGS